MFSKTNKCTNLTLDLQAVPHYNLYIFSKLSIFAIVFELKEILKDRRIILGSASPRRRQLLEEMDLEFSVDNSFSGEESYPHELIAEEVPEYLAKQKSHNFTKELSKNDILLTADTVVILDSQILGKPKDERDAFAMLSALSGKIHKVVTGVCLRDRERSMTFSDCSYVEFYQLTASDINYYIKTYSPLDKAGAYGIQEWIGAVAIKKIEGSYYNIMGLPTELLYHKLQEFLNAPDK